MALGAAIAVGIAGYIFTQTGNDAEDATDDERKETVDESQSESKFKIGDGHKDNGEDSSNDGIYWLKSLSGVPQTSSILSSNDDSKTAIEPDKKEDHSKPASTESEKKEEKSKKDDSHKDVVTPNTNTGDVYASPVTEYEISKKNPKDGA